ncbi:MAG: M1 family peptidase [Betaproteobacteria bacterium]|nr:M1 family peptidase [Betaproteobacteria bacterium]
MNALRRLCALCAGALFSVSCLAAPPRAAHLDLDVTLDPESRAFRATAEWVAASESRFLLHHALSIGSASADGVATPAAPARRAGAMQAWRIDARPGAVLRVEYSGTLPHLDRTLDHRQVLSAMPPMAAREGSFLPAGAGWYPRPANLFSYRVRLSLPSDQRGLVPGRLLAEAVPREIGERYLATFSFEQPADGIDLMAGPYAVRERIVKRRDAEPLRLRTYFERDLDALADAYLDDSRRYLELYSDLIGAYPFTEFSVVASPLPTGFGMPTLTYIGSRVLKLPFIRATSLGHEVLHNWWGNGVYPDYARGNWSEGLTTFMADYFYRARESEAAAREMRLAWLRDFAAVPSEADRPLATFRSRTHGADAAIGYGKSAMLFVMLRDLIGAEAFERGIRAFWNRHRFRVAAWDDLRRAFEESSGRPLRSFFTQWLDRPGAPRLAVVTARANAQGGATRLVLEFSQGEPAYALRVPVELVTGNRSELRWLDISHARETVALAVDAVPDAVRLDPELRLWRTLEREQLPPILRQWIVARTPSLAVVSSDADVRLAAQELARHFFERPAKQVDHIEAVRGPDPLLIIGRHREVDAVLSMLKLPGRPANLAGVGSAQVWTIRGENGGALIGVPIAVISARDAASLTALLRPLPHYGAQSYLAFDGSRAVERGVWAAPGRLVSVTRSPR